MKEIVTISRHWNNPEIRMTVNSEAISLEIDLSNFLEALRQEINLDDMLEALRKEIGSVTYVFRQKTFDEIFATAVGNVMKRGTFNEGFKTACDIVAKRIKAESRKVVAL